MFRYAILIRNKKIAELLGVGPDKKTDTANLIWIYSESKSERLIYTCDFIFRHFLKIDYRIITQIADFPSNSSPLINYSFNSEVKGIQIRPSGLMSETGIRKEKPEARTEREKFCLFPHKEDSSFDIFSAVFYMISRYEEWQEFAADRHGRFELDQSILFKHKMHLRPVVDEWNIELRDTIKARYSSFEFPSREFRTLASIDVDNLYAYQHKGFVRTCGAILKDLIRLNFANAKRRIAVIRGLEKDPFDVYDTFSEFCHSNKIPLIYFFLFNNKGEYNRTIDPDSQIFPRTFDRVKKKEAVVGLHPSYDSKKNKTGFSLEYNKFTLASGEKTEFTRQHYLQFSIKETPQLLMESGINADFSMGFASGSGFRAGTSEAFPYYDLRSEKKTELLLVPFCAMDGAYFIYQHISAEKALHELLQIKEAIRKVGGLFTTVFHERTFDDTLYPGFGEMYKKLLKTYG